MNKKTLGAIGASMLLASCTSGNSAIEPAFTSANVAANKLVFAVGTANYQGLITGLNTVVSFRQSNGSSGTLVNTPAISGPSGFLVPNVASAGVDGGTASITGAPQSQQPGGTVTADTFGQAGGAFSYGFLPLNATNNFVANGNGGYAPYPQPLYAEPLPKGSSTKFLGGPPAYTNVRTGTYPAGFVGFSQGFGIFAGTTLAPGSYGLVLTIPSSPTTNTTVAASATLGNTTSLSTYANPIVADDGSNGATITLTVPAGVNETIVDVVDTGQDANATAPAPCHGSYSAPYYYTVVDHTAGPATVVVNLPGNVGPVSPATNTATPTLCKGDDYTAYAVGTDYRAYESGPGQPDPAGLAQVPNFLTGSQADVTISGPSASASGIYGQSIARKIP